MWFCLAALVPIAAAALVTRTMLTSALREEASRAKEVSGAEMRRVIRSGEDAVASRVEGLASREDPYAFGTLIELDTGGGVLPTWARKRVRDAGAPLMRQLSLDLLYLLDQRYQVLDAPHYMPALGERAVDLGERARTTEGRPYYAMETVLDQQTIKKVLVVEAGRQLREGQYSITVIGGKRLGPPFLESVRKLDGVQVRIVSANGEELVPPKGTWQGGADIFSFPLNDHDGKEVARVELRANNEALPALLKKVTLYSAALAVAALLLTILLGFLVARSMTRNLNALVVGAQAAARGDLDHQVETSSDDEIGEVGEALNTMMVDLKESKERLMMAERVAAWQEIARRLAHEIKNPLTPIQMSMETLRKAFAKKHPSFDEVFEESTATVLEEAARLRRIVSEFSEFARMPKPNKRTVAINDLIRSQLALYQGTGQIQASLMDGLPSIEADKDTICQLLLNLIENARDAISSVPDATIVVSTESTRGGKAVAIHIDDNGPGIGADAREKLFTPYYTTKHAQGGTGLGLAIAHRIVSDHHGQIMAGASPLGGARFTVELPAQGAGDEVLIASMTSSMKRFR